MLIIHFLMYFFKKNLFRIFDTINGKMHTNFPNKECKKISVIKTYLIISLFIF